MANADAGSTSAVERAYGHIRHGILSGDLLSGTMLSESELAAKLGVSRTPVRSALARLQDEGWLTIFPKRGALVRTLSERDIDELAEAKTMIESNSVRRTADSALVRLARELESHLDEQQTALETGDVGTFVELSVSFHRSFVTAAGNSVVLELYDRLADRQRFLLYSFGDRLLERSASIVDEHRELLAAVTAGNADEFRDLLEGHLTNTYHGGPRG